MENCSKRKIETIVPYTIGGLIDTACPIVDDELHKKLGLHVSIVHKAKSGGIAGVKNIVYFNPDADTLPINQ